MAKKIIYVTGSRSDYGLMSAFLNTLKDKGLSIGVGLTLSSDYVNEIQLDIWADFSHDYKDIITSTTYLMKEWDRFFKSNDIDILIGMGDRWELVPVFYASFLNGITNIHFSAGEITKGSMDNVYRDIITKLSHYAMTATEFYKNRVISLGMDEDKVFVVGEIGLWDIKTMNKEKLKKNLPFDLPDNYIVLSLHPEYPFDVDKYNYFLSNLAKIPYSIIASSPSVEPYSDEILQLYKEYKDRVIYYPHFGRKRYISLMKYALCVVGNSSSGIVEAPSLKVPSIDIGRRQEGRIRSKSVYHIDWYDDIVSVIGELIENRNNLDYTNPYMCEDGFNKAVNIIQGIADE